MKQIEDRCVDCGLPCIGSRCPHKNVIVYYCDSCEEELGCEFYVVDGEELCEDCLKERFRKEW